MQYVPIVTMLKALKAAGMTDIEVGRQIGLAGSNVCRLRNGQLKDTASSIYFAMYALWTEKLKEVNNDNQSR